MYYDLEANRIYHHIVSVGRGGRCQSSSGLDSSILNWAVGRIVSLSGLIGPDPYQAIQNMQQRFYRGLQAVADNQTTNPGKTETFQDKEGSKTVTSATQYFPSISERRFNEVYSRGKTLSEQRSKIIAEKTKRQEEVGKRKKREDSKKTMKAFEDAVEGWTEDDCNTYNFYHLMNEIFYSTRNLT